MAMDQLCRGGRAAFPVALAAALTLAGCAVPDVARAQATRPAAVAGPAEQALTYADLAGLVETAPTIAVVEIRDQATVERERSPGLAPGEVRLYLQARTEALLAGRSAVGESLNFLADRTLLPNGKAPRLRKQRFILFADTVPGRPGQLQLVDPKAMVPAEPVLMERLRSVISAFAAQDLPPKVTGLRDVISVPGNLVGESETQMFVETASGAPVSLSVVRRPGMEPSWGVSWSEIVDSSARPPQPETVEWYRLACALPAELPAEAFLQPQGPSRQQAQEDYRFVLQQLGPCERRRGQAPTL
jgi:hypothetical protein